MQNTSLKPEQGLGKFDAQACLEKLNLTADLLELTGQEDLRAEILRSSIQSLRVAMISNQINLKFIQNEWLSPIEQPIRDEILGIAFNAPENLLVKISPSVPASVQEMLAIAGLGPKRLREVWKTMNISTISALYQATIENRLQKAKGFGPKTQAKVKLGIEAMRMHGKTYFYADLMPIAAKLDKQLKTLIGNDSAFSITGDLRASRPLCNGIQFIVHSDFFKDVMIMLIREDAYELMTAGQDLLLARIRGTEIPIEFRFHANDFFAQLFKSTGSKHHFQFVPIDFQRNYESEAEIYNDCGLKFLPAELREAKEELMPLMNREMQFNLIQKPQIKGILNVHSSISDGLDDLEKLARECIALGMEYLGISDHAPNAWHGLGATEANFVLQKKQIDTLNKSLAPFKIFWGVEADIQNDGGFGLENDFLDQFDFVIASLNTNENLTPAEATLRCVKAIRNPRTTILAHPSGRLLLGTEGYPVDLELLMSECLENNVALELNCMPTRMDLSWENIRKASKMGCMVSINSDAHSITELNDFEPGVAIARKGLLPSSQCLNAMTKEEFSAWLKQRNSFG